MGRVTENMAKSMMKSSTVLRNLLKKPGTLFVPGCFNAMSARVLMKAGFPAVYMTGYGTSLSLLGLPDAGYATMCEMQLNAYLDAGADMAFVEGPTTREEVEQVCEQVKGPVLYNQTGVSPKFSLPELNELGVKLAIVPNALTRCAVTAMYDLAVQLKEDPLNETF